MAISVHERMQIKHILSLPIEAVTRDQMDFMFMVVARESGIGASPMMERRIQVEAMVPLEEEEITEVRELEKYIQAIARAGGLTQPQKKKVRDPMFTPSEGGNVNSIPCPVDLYDDDENYSAWVKHRTSELLNRQDRVSRDTLIREFRNYPVYKSWLSRQGMKATGTDAVEIEDQQSDLRDL